MKQSDTQQIHARIADDIRTGDSYRIIAKRWGCSISSISKIAAKHGIRRRRRIQQKGNGND